MRLIIGNRNYSSWSLRGWLAAKQSGLAFGEVVLNGLIIGILKNRTANKVLKS